MAYIDNISVHIDHNRLLSACTLQELLSIKGIIDVVIKDRVIKEREASELKIASNRTAPINFENNLL